MDHVIPARDGGPTTFENLSLACVSCSLRKGARTHAADPHSSRIVRIFNPRVQLFGDHFEARRSGLLVGRTPEGRATVIRLKMNRPIAVEIRREEIARRAYP